MTVTSNGKIATPTQNDFLRTRSRYSRRITIRVLCTVVAPRVGGDGRLRRPLHLLDEDVVERRRDDLEPPDPEPADRRLEHALGIGAGLELDLGVLAELVHARHRGQGLQEGAVTVE